MDNNCHDSRQSNSPSRAQKHAVVVDLYGISGIGKSFLRDRLRQVLGEELFNYHKDSSVTAGIVHGGLEAFQLLDEREKAHRRKQAIESVGRNSIETGKAAEVVWQRR